MLEHLVYLGQPLDLTVIKSYRARLCQHGFLSALAGCLKDVSGVDVRRKGVSAAKIMSRMQAMLFANVAERVTFGTFLRDKACADE